MSLEAASSVLGTIMVNLCTLIVVNLTTVKDLEQVCLIALTAAYTVWKWREDRKRSKKGE